MSPTLPGTGPVKHDGGADGSDRPARPPRGDAMIDHVTANVGDFAQAKRFYEQALAPLGYSVHMEFEGAAGFGSGEGIPDFWIGSIPERGATHIAFSAADRSAVDAFHEAALAAV